MKLLAAIIGLFFVLNISSCNTDKPLFELVDANHSGIQFNNEVKESDSLNVLDISNVYNGGGVGIGDFNGDGLQDIYFTGNKVSNKLYLNIAENREKFALLHYAC